MEWLADQITGFIQGVIDLIGSAWSALINWLWSAFEALMEWLRVAYEAIADFIWDVLGDIWGWISANTQNIIDRLLEWAYEFLVTIKDWLLEWLGGFSEWIDDQLESLGVEVSIDDMKSAGTTLADGYADAAWLLPLNGVAAIAVTTILAIAFIRLVRWIISALWITG